MSIKLKDIVGNIFHTEEKSNNEETQKTAQLQQKTNNVFGKTDSYNPYLKKNGELVNPYLNYQQILDNPNVSNKAKEYITQATGLTQTQTSPKIGNIIQSTGGSYTSTGNNIADAAQKYIGTPYVWGGESASEGGMDCSGFVYNALKDAGYNVGRTTAQGYRNGGKTVSKSNMQPGDLIFYGKNGEATHIGIYIGNGQMIHSSGGSKNTKANPGKGVTIANVDHRSDFIEARRY